MVETFSVPQLITATGADTEFLSQFLLLSPQFRDTLFFTGYIKTRNAKVGCFYFHHKGLSQNITALGRVVPALIGFIHYGRVSQFDYCREYSTNWNIVKRYLATPPFFSHERRPPRPSNPKRSVTSISVSVCGGDCIPKFCEAHTRRG